METSNSATSILEDEQWLAVATRNAAADGRFVYGVTSTRIYCRPTCPSRRPQRDRVVYFATCEAAEHAGFRPCLRCHPSGMSRSDELSKLIEASCRILEKEGPVSLGTLAKRIGMSPHYLHRIFRLHLGVTPKQYALSVRVNRFREAVTGETTVTAASYEAGFGSSRGLYENAKDRLGMTPAQYKRKSYCGTIWHAVVDSPLGKLLVAATAEGICMIAMADTASELQDDLAGRFPAARIEGSSSILESAIRKVLGFLAGAGSSTLDLPLDVRATAFQASVWETLRGIPYGQTRSYSQVAKAIGRPSAVRAVARACASNPVSLATPCHRVTRNDGDLSGYRWGKERKRALLALERRELNKKNSLDE